ncbi:hypothetical protein [Streptomyces galilaeus]|uniref:hypothetical protein n=1 Tax=Streptomyces galilaeus TaxID=33899 RepID=UPI0038F78B71
MEEAQSVNGEPWQREVIDLMMKEYESLRAEVTQRINARQQAAGYAGAATAIIAAIGGDIGVWRWVIVFAVVLLVVLFLQDSNKAIQRIGLHLQKLERDVNDLAMEIYGREVLTWETRRQGQRRRERVCWKFLGIVGGWHLRKPGKELPPTVPNAL